VEVLLNTLSTRGGQNMWHLSPVFAILLVQKNREVPEKSFRGEDDDDD
jgi:hypothetical protein